MIPYLSQELRCNEGKYENLCIALDEVFGWIEDKVRSLTTVL